MPWILFILFCSLKSAIVFLKGTNLIELKLQTLPIVVDSRLITGFGRQPYSGIM